MKYREISASLFTFLLDIKRGGAVIGVVFVLAGTELVSFLSIHMLGLSNVSLPWSFILLLLYGFITPVFIALCLITLLIGSLYLWLLGGVRRYSAKIMLLLTVGFIAANSIAVMGYSLWENTVLTPFPWVSYSLLISLPHGSEAFMHFTVCLLFSIVGAVVIALFPVLKKRVPAGKIFGQAHFSDAIEIHKAGLFSETGMVIGKAFGHILRLPGFEGMLVTAPMGGGKTTSIVIPNLLEWVGSGLFNDLKGELHRLTAVFRETQLGNQCYQWAPSDKRKKTHQYNPFYYVSTHLDLRIRDLQLIAEIIIPPERVDGGFWYTSSRDLFLMLAIYLFETKGMATLSEIHDLSKQKDFMSWLEFAVAKKQVKDPIFYQNAYSLLNSDKDKAQKNIIKDFHSRMALFADPIVRHATNGNDFDLTQLRRKKISIYITIPDSDKERLKPILTLFWAQCINLLTQHEPNVAEEPYPILALLDEFGMMARINKIKDGTAFFRSYRIRAIIIVQYLSQIMSVYGHHDSKGFLNAKVKIAFALNDPDDALYFSKALGAKTVKVTSHGSSHGQHTTSSHNIQFQSRPLMTPDEIMQMNTSEEIILMEAHAPIKAKKCYWFKEKRYKDMVL